MGGGGGDGREGGGGDAPASKFSVTVLSELINIYVWFV